MHGACSRVASLDIVFLSVSVFPWLGTLYRIVTLLATVETGEMAQILASYTGYVGGMDTGGWGEVFPGSLVI